MNYVPTWCLTFLILATLFGYLYNVVLNNITDVKVDRLKSIWLNPLAKNIVDIEFARKILRIYVILFVIFFTCFTISSIFYSKLMIIQIMAIIAITIVSNILGIIYNSSIDRTWLRNLAMIFSISLSTMVYTITSFIHMIWIFLTIFILMTIIQILNQYQEYEIECMFRKTVMCNETSRKINLILCLVLTIVLTYLGYYAFNTLHILNFIQFITFEILTISYVIATIVAIVLEFSRNPKIKIVKHVIKHVALEISMRWIATRILLLTWLTTLMI